MPPLKRIAAPNAPSGGAKPEPVGQHEPGEGGRPHRVGEEGQAAQDDPGAEQAGRNGEDQDLDQGALDEGELERIEHGPRSIQE